MGAHSEAQNTALLKQDAKNRALRTLVQGFSADLVAALAVWVIPLMTDIEAWEDFEWQVIALLVFKTLVLTLFSFLMRRFVDDSGVPTPLPPTPQPQPADADAGAEAIRDLKADEGDGL